MFVSSFDKSLIIFFVIILGIIFVSANMVTFSPPSNVPFHYLEEVVVSTSCSEGQYLRVGGSNNLECATIVLDGLALPDCDPAQALVMTVDGWGCKDESLLGLRRLNHDEVNLFSAETYGYKTVNPYGKYYYSEKDDSTISSISVNISPNWEKLFDSDLETFVDVVLPNDLIFKIDESFNTKPITVFIRYSYLDKDGHDALGLGNTVFTCRGTSCDCTFGCSTSWCDSKFTSTTQYSTNGTTYNPLDSQVRGGEENFSRTVDQCVMREINGLLLNGSMVGEYLKFSSTASAKLFYYSHISGVCELGGATGCQLPPGKVRVYELEFWVRE